MNIRGFLFATIALAVTVQADKIGHDEVKPFPQPEPVTISEKAAVKFKPQLHVTNGCHAYSVVNEAGETSGRLQNTGKPSSKRKGSGWGSQLYARSTWYSGVWAIMYTWCFPKDSPSTRLGHRHDWEHVVVTENPGSLASSHSVYSKHVPPTADSVDGPSVKINYESHWPINHELDTTSKAGEFQDVIMWHQMSEAARQALSTTDFGKANVPLNDDNFLPKLDKSWPL